MLRRWQRRGARLKIEIAKLGSELAELRAALAEARARAQGIDPAAVARRVN